MKTAYDVRGQNIIDHCRLQEQREDSNGNDTSCWAPGVSVPLCRAALHHLTDAHSQGWGAGAGERKTRSGPPDQTGGPGAHEGSKDLLVIRQLEASQAGICCSGTTPRKRGLGPCIATQDLRSSALVGGGSRGCAPLGCCLHSGHRWKAQPRASGPLSCSK